MGMLVFCIFATILHRPIWFIFFFSPSLFSLNGLFHQAHFIHFWVQPWRSWCLAGPCPTLRQCEWGERALSSLQTGYFLPFDDDDMTTPLLMPFESGNIALCGYCPYDRDLRGHTIVRRAGLQAY